MKLQAIRRSHFLLSITVLLFTAVFLATGCKKRVFDYRNKYLGDYQIEYIQSHWQMNQPTTTDTTQIAATISYDKKGPKDELKLHFNNKDLTLNVDQEGKITMCKSVIGKFEYGDYFTIVYSSNTCASGGLGGGTNYRVTGEK